MRNTQSLPPYCINCFITCLWGSVHVWFQGSRFTNFVCVHNKFSLITYLSDSVFLSLLFLNFWHNYVKTQNSGWKNNDNKCIFSLHQLGFLVHFKNIFSIHPIYCSAFTTFIINFCIWSHETWANSQLVHLLVETK